MMIPCNYYINVAKRSARYPLGEHYATIELGDCQQKVAKEKFEEISKMFDLNLFKLSLYYVECYGKPVADTQQNDEYAINTVEAEYTGGGIWFFYGKLKNGRDYLVEDNGWTVIVDTDPRLIDSEDLTYEWIDEHKIQELTGQEGVKFRMAMLDLIESDNKFGFEEWDMEHYRREFRKEGN